MDQSTNRSTSCQAYGTKSALRHVEAAYYDLGTLSLEGYDDSSIVKIFGAQCEFKDHDELYYIDQQMKHQESYGDGRLVNREYHANLFYIPGDYVMVATWVVSDKRWETLGQRRNSRDWCQRCRVFIPVS